MTPDSARRTLRRNDVYLSNRVPGQFVVVIEAHPSNGEVRWVKHPVPHGTTAGGAVPVAAFLRDYTRVGADTDIARAVVRGASELAAKLPQPSRWGAPLKRVYNSYR